MKIVKIFCISMIALFIFTSYHNAKTGETINESKSESESQHEKSQPAKTESPEEKAVRLAEEFIKQNGYTDVPADKENLSHETVEFYDNIEELLEARKNTLESKAFGIHYRGRGNEKGWTVVFRYNKSYLKDLPQKDYQTLGRAVTMNENFENLLVEHKNIFLEKTDKKF